MAPTVKNKSAVRETQVWSLGWDNPLEKGMATHSSILAWRIPWTGKPSRLYSPWDCKDSDTTERLTLSLFKNKPFTITKLRVSRSFPDFCLFFFNWRIIALQCCVGFCLTTMWISHKYTYISSLLRLSPQPDHPSRSLHSPDFSTINTGPYKTWYIGTKKSHDLKKKKISQILKNSDTTMKFWYTYYSEICSKENRQNSKQTNQK